MVRGMGEKKEGKISLRIRLKEPTKEIVFKSNVPLEYRLDRVGDEVFISLRYPIVGPRRIIRSTWDKPEEDEV